MTDPRPDPDRSDALLAVLEEQHALVEELHGLADRQAGFVREGRIDALLGLLTRRQTIIDRFLVAQDELARLTDDLDAHLRGADRDRRARMKSLVDTVGSRLQEVMARDEEDRTALETARDTTRGELASLGSARQARDAYRTTGTVDTRFADQKG